MMILVCLLYVTTIMCHWTPSLKSLNTMYDIVNYYNSDGNEICQGQPDRYVAIASDCSVYNGTCNPIGDLNLISYCDRLDVTSFTEPMVAQYNFRSQNCQGDPFVAQFFKLNTCVKVGSQMYYMFQCSVGQGIMYDCNDEQCSNCVQSATYTDGQCSSSSSSMQSVGWKCINTDDFNEHSVGNILDVNWIGFVLTWIMAQMFA